MVLLAVREYGGKELTEPEIAYIKCIDGERDRVKNDQKEKDLQRQLLSQISIAQVAIIEHFVIMLICIYRKLQRRLQRLLK
jgi:hypothetical protein